MGNCATSFTVVLPVKNGGEYLPLCVASILAQTYQGFELVILENQSTDGTTEWLQTLEETDSRVKVIPAKTSLSMEENWNRILDVPKKEYMTVIGHDDLLEPDFLDEINSLIDSEPEANLYLTHFKLIDSKGKLIRHCKPIPKHETSAGFLAARMAEIRDSFGTGHVIRSEIYDKLRGIPLYKNLLYADDALWLSLMHHSYKATSSKVCFSYRLHSGSASGKPNQEALFDGLKQYLVLLGNLASEDEDMARVINMYAPQYVSKRLLSTYYHDLLDAFRWKRRDNTIKLSELESMLKKFAPEATLDKSYRGLLVWGCRGMAAWLFSKCV